MTGERGEWMDEGGCVLTIMAVMRRWETSVLLSFPIQSMLFHSYTWGDLWFFLVQLKKKTSTSIRLPLFFPSCSSLQRQGSSVSVTSSWCWYRFGIIRKHILTESEVLPNVSVPMCECLCMCPVLFVFKIMGLFLAMMLMWQNGATTKFSMLRSTIQKV